MASLKGNLCHVITSCVDQSNKRAGSAENFRPKQVQGLEGTMLGVKQSINQAVNHSNRQSFKLSVTRTVNHSTCLTESVSQLHLGPVLSVEISQPQN